MKKGVKATPDIDNKNIIHGEVSNCNLLNVRTEPNINSPEIKVIERGTEVIINQDKSTKDWWALFSEGYCKKNYITIKK